MEQFLLKLFELIITFPGAALVWLYFKLFGKPKTYRDCFESYYTTNSILGFLLIAATVLFLRYLIA